MAQQKCAITRRINIGIGYGRRQTLVVRCDIADVDLRMIVLWRGNNIGDLRFVRIAEQVWQRTGRLMEKYNVEDTQLEAGGGEYPAQDGFGWTNGVVRAMIERYNLRSRE